MERITVKLRFNDFKDSWIKTKFQSQCLKISSGKSKIEELWSVSSLWLNGKTWLHK